MRHRVIKRTDERLVHETCGNRRRLRKLQDNFTREPFLAPIKPYLTPELACNYVFHNARAEPTILGRRDCRST